MATNTLLYNKYRPKKFSEVAGNKEITDILQGLVRNNNIRNIHYCLSGTAGTGKTTTSRILAKAINCKNPQDGEPCNECEHCKQFDAGTYLDYIEVDGTSYNKVEDAKRLVELASQYPLVNGYHRIVMIDEAHRLSNAAWDKFLILLESADVKTIFIFATTDIHAIRPAILSRCMTFSVKPLSARDIAQEILRIVKAEKVEYTLDAVNKLAYNYANKPRDAIKNLDLHIRAYGNLLEYNKESTEATLLKCFKLAYFNKINEYLEILNTLDVSKLYTNLTRMISEVFLYPQIAPILINPKDIEEFKTLVDNQNFKTIVKDILTFKPDDQGSLILILAQVSLLGDKLQQKQTTQNQTRGRRFVTNQQTSQTLLTPVDIDSEPETKPAPQNVESKQDIIVSAPEKIAEVEQTNLKPNIDLTKYGFTEVIK